MQQTIIKRSKATHRQATNGTRGTVFLYSIEVLNRGHELSEEVGHIFYVIAFIVVAIKIIATTVGANHNHLRSCAIAGRSRGINVYLSTIQPIVIATISAMQHIQHWIFFAFIIAFGQIHRIFHSATQHRALNGLVAQLGARSLH